jgi:polysaccharide biosynthesis protein PslH
VKILFLAHRIPYPPNKGEKTRCFHELRYLAARHSIDLFCFADSDREAEGKQGLEQFCRTVHVETLPPRIGLARAAGYAWSGLPASILYYRSRTMQKAVRKALEEESYDLIFVYCSSMAQFIPDPAPAVTMIDFVDADSSKWKQYASRSVFPKSWFYTREGSLLARYEKQVANDFDVSIVATLQESLELGGGGCSSVEVVENGVTPPSTKGPQSLPAEIQKLQPYVLFVGTMNYRPNADAVTYFSEEIFPILLRSHPELRFLIVGRDPTAQVQKLARRPGIVVTGAVPDVHAFIDGAAVAVAPFRIAQGVQNKVLEALVAGVPVVLTSRPARAIGGTARDLLLVADAPDEFAEGVRSVLENPEFRRRAAAAAPSLRESLGWESRLKHLGALVESLTSCPSGARQRVAREVVVG